MDPDMFVSRAKFIESVEHLIGQLKYAKRATRVDEIMIPGERAHQERQKRTKDGIPIDAPTWHAITKIMSGLFLADKYASV